MSQSFDFIDLINEWEICLVDTGSRGYLLLTLTNDPAVTRLTVDFMLTLSTFAFFTQDIGSKMLCRINLSCHSPYSAKSTFQ